MDAVFIKVLNMALTASFVILAVMLMRLFTKRISRRLTCVLWALVAIRLIMPFSLQTAFSLIPSPSPVTVAQTVEATVTEPADPITQTPESTRPRANRPAVPTEAEVDAAAQSDPVPPIAVITPKDTDGVPAQNEPKKIAFRLDVTHIAALVWLIGAAAMLVYGAVSTALLYFRMQFAVMKEGNVYQSEHISSPFVLGLIKPRIFIPYGMDADTQKYVLAHERTHLRRFDHITKPFGFILLCVYWFDPLVWLSYILLCRDIESACDEAVIRSMNGDDRSNYAEALLMCGSHRSRLSACPLAFGESNTKQRIKSVLNYKKPAFWIVIVSVVVVIAAVVCFLTDPLSIRADTPDDTSNETSSETVSQTDESSKDISDSSQQNHSEPSQQETLSDPRMTGIKSVSFEHKPITADLSLIADHTVQIGDNVYSLSQGGYGETNNIYKYDLNTRTMSIVCTFETTDDYFVTWNFSKMYYCNGAENDVLMIKVHGDTEPVYYDVTDGREIIGDERATLYKPHDANGVMVDGRLFYYAEDDNKTLYTKHPLYGYDIKIKVDDAKSIVKSLRDEEYYYKNAAYLDGRLYWTDQKTVFMYNCAEQKETVIESYPGKEICYGPVAIGGCVYYKVYDVEKYGYPADNGDGFAYWGSDLYEINYDTPEWINSDVYMFFVCSDSEYVLYDTRVVTGNQQWAEHRPREEYSGGYKLQNVVFDEHEIPVDLSLLTEITGQSGDNIYAVMSQGVVNTGYTLYRYDLSKRKMYSVCTFDMPSDWALSYDYWMYVYDRGIISILYPGYDVNGIGYELYIDLENKCAMSENEYDQWYVRNSKLVSVQRNALKIRDDGRFEIWQDNYKHPNYGEFDGYDYAFDFERRKAVFKFAGGNNESVYLYDYDTQEMTYLFTPEYFIVDIAFLDGRYIVYYNSETEDTVFVYDMQTETTNSFNARGVYWQIVNDLSGSEPLDMAAYKDGVIYWASQDAYSDNALYSYDCAACEVTTVAKYDRADIEYGPVIAQNRVFYKVYGNDEGYPGNGWGFGFNGIGELYMLQNGDPMKVDEDVGAFFVCGSGKYILYRKQTGAADEWKEYKLQ